MKNQKEKAIMKKVNVLFFEHGNILVLDFLSSRCTGTKYHMPSKRFIISISLLKNYLANAFKVMLFFQQL